MAGTRAGGLKAAMTNLKNNPNFYREIGKKGGQNGHTGGFASMTHDQVVEAGAKGGRISRRGPARELTVEEYARKYGE